MLKMAFPPVGMFSMMLILNFTSDKLMQLFLIMLLLCKCILFFVLVSL